VRYRRSPRVLERHVAGGVLATTPSDPAIHELSGGAASVWSELVLPWTVDEVVGRLAAAHGAERGSIADQVLRCIEELLAIGLLEEVADA